jgi:hypothetical protein
MGAGKTVREQTRWFFFGSAALAAHFAALLLLPDTAPCRETPKISAFTLFMTVAADTVQAAHDAPQPGLEARLSAPSAGPRQAQPTRTREMRGTTQRRGALVGEAGPSQNATLSERKKSALAARDGRPQGDPHEAEADAATASALADTAGVATRAEPAQGLVNAADQGSTSAGGVGRERAASAAGLLRGPGLLGASPCRGYFPAQATAARGAVQIEVRVDETGHAVLSRLLRELPQGQGFGPAAHACAAALRFVPAVNRDGAAVAGEAKLELTFSRS